MGGPAVVWLWGWPVQIIYGTIRIVLASVFGICQESPLYVRERFSPCIIL